MDDPETFEAVFCRIASEVIRDENLASLTKTMHPDLFRFIHVCQQRIKMHDQRPEQPPCAP